jgi:NAD(P)-dependent dehydrogenase (short-subunit alcohol dehydrogenase family)
MGVSLTTLPHGYRAAVFGAAGGIGGAIARTLCDDPRCAIVHAGARSPVAGLAAKAQHFRFDLENEASISAAAETITRDGPLDLVIVATGLLHAEGIEPEKSWRALQADALMRSFAVNAVGPALIAKHLLPRLARPGKAVFAALSARVGSISDNRLGGWHAYRASKAALNMLVRTLSIELARSHPAAACITLHPGTVDTGLSAPYQRGVSPERLFTAEAAAGRLLGVIDSATSVQTGLMLDWTGSQIPF